MSYWKISQNFRRNEEQMKRIEDYLAKPDKTIGEHASDLLRMAAILWELKYISDEHMYYLLREACQHHDDGKANVEFEKRIEDKNKVFNPDKEVPHNILSIFYLDPDKYKNNHEDYLKIACAIAHHHNYCDEAQLMREKKSLIEHLLIDEYCFKLKGKDILKIFGTEILNPDTKILKGLLHKCDYSASGNYLVEYPNDFLLESLDRMMNLWKEKNPASNWNDLQKFCIKNREENVIAVASTGMGKTEAGLQWIGNTKGFFILPIRTAINAIYDRVKEDILWNEKLNERLALLHSESLEYYHDHVEEMDIVEYHDRGKSFSLPLNISTMDQLFDFVFKYKGYEMKLAMLAYSKIVIDEIQMYDEELLAYLICGLRQIHELGGKIAIVTATLPPYIKEILKRDAGITFQEQYFTSDVIRHSVRVTEGAMSVDDILACYQKNNDLCRSNKILVVCNTIRKAQQIYEQIKNADETVKVHIFHSRFTNGDKKRLEAEIREFGKTYSDTKKQIIDKQTGIWISTSLVEVSLDIDFDYLFTELSELNALFQRMGRCNRKGKKRVDEYNCFVYYEGAEVKCGKKGYVDKIFYDLSTKALQNVDGLTSEIEKTNLIDKYFTMEKVLESDFMRKYREIFGYFKELGIGTLDENMNLRTILTQNIVPRSVYEEHKEQIISLEVRMHEIEKEMRKQKSHVQNKEVMNERLEIKEKLNDFVVSIPKYEYRLYCKKIWESFGTVQIDRYRKVPVMDCYYDEKGYYPLNYNEESIRDEIMMF